MTKYRKIMARIAVTPEMRERVLVNIALHEEQELQRSGQKKRKIHRFVSLASAAVAACFVLAVGIRVYQANNPPVKEEPYDVASNGVEEYDSLAGLEAACGFPVPEVEKLPFEKTEVFYTNAFGIARIDYYGTADEFLTISKAADDGSDISGDYNTYDFIKEETIQNSRVTMKGSGDMVSLALWSQGGYAYAVSVSPGMAKADMIEMVELIIHK